MNPAIQIESGIPVPEKRFSKWREYAAAVEKFEVGQSILCIDMKSAVLSTAVIAKSRRAGKRFTSRTIGKDVRIWRIE